MKPHILLRTGPNIPVAEPLPYWEDLIADKSLARTTFYAPVDEILAKHDVPIWATHEYRAAAGAFSVEEIAAGLNRIYRLVLQRDEGVPASLVREIELVPGIEYARIGQIGTAELPPIRAAALAVTTDRHSREAIHLDEAHQYSRGDRSVTVAVLDTGVELDHPELADVLAPGYDFVDIIDGAGKFLGDFLGADELPDDEVGHGTHVAGIIAAKGIGMPAGVVPVCRLMPVRVLGALEKDGRRVGAGLIDNINNGIKWAVDNGADVINMSLGVAPVGGELPHEEVIDYARQKGVSVVAASGNDGSPVSRYFPGALPYVVTVGAFDEGGEVAAFSTYGEEIDLIAPGTNIYSSSLNKGYAFSNGTSHATPFVSGGIALLHAVARKRGARLADRQVKYLLKNTADRVDNRFKNRKAGFGRLNLIDAVRLLDHKLKRTESAYAT
jgi:thermitase